MKSAKVSCPGLRHACSGQSVELELLDRPRLPVLGEVAGPRVRAAGVCGTPGQVGSAAAQCFPPLAILGDGSPPHTTFDSMVGAGVPCRQPPPQRARQCYKHAFMQYTHSLSTHPGVVTLNSGEYTGHVVLVIGVTNKVLVASRAPAGQYWWHSCDEGPALGSEGAEVAAREQGREPGPEDLGAAGHSKGLQLCLCGWKGTDVGLSGKAGRACFTLPIPEAWSA